ncbi:retrovirus-related pol polyprotein from transposon TNT 1-94 [Tanacetum coccineum]
MESNDKNKDSKKKAGGNRKKTLARKRAGEKQSKESAKRQKIEDDAEKKELRAHLDIIPGDDVAVSVESLATTYPIVDWKTHVLSEDKMYYKIIKANGSTKSYKIFIEMLDDFDSWRLFDSCGIHVLLMDIVIAIHMLIEKTYPLTQEMLSRTLSGKLEVDNESEMAFELLRFTRSQIEKTIINVVSSNTSIELLNDPNMPELEDIVYSGDAKDVGTEADMNKLNTFMPTLVDLPNGKRPLGTRWVFRNKKDKRGIVIKNKARLVAQGYTQEERIDYDEVFDPVARIEAIRLFLAYASFKDFVVYQIDVKSCQPPRFEDPDFLDRVYKVEKALYRMHQALRAWYETLSTYLLDNGFQSGEIDKTLFIRRDKVKQKEDGIFISQDKYVTEILKKFSFTDVMTASTPMETQKSLLKDEDGEEVDVHLYRSMIGSLMYLTSSKPDIMFAVYSPFDLVAYTNSDYAGASLDRKSTTEVAFLTKSVESEGFEQIVDFLNASTIKYALTVHPIIYISCIEQFWSTVKAKTVNGEVQLQALVDGKKIITTEATIKREL